MNKHLTALLAFLFYLFSVSVSAQKIDSIINANAANFPQEKIHIHFDKNSYNKGETIWFKAYLMAGSEPIENSKTLYLDWFDEEGNLLKHFTAPIIESSAFGHIEIPQNYSSDIIRVKAYTKWMMNFDSAFYFIRNIQVFQTIKKQTSTIPKTTVNFFPEGGSIISGLTSRVAFMATNQMGLPVFIKGFIKDNNGNIIDSFKAEHDGMGCFLLKQPNINNPYSFYWKDEYGNENLTPMPIAQVVGVNMQVEKNKDKVKITVHRSEGDSNTGRMIHIIAHINQRVVYRSKMNLTNLSSGIANIPVAELPTGILQITLFDVGWLPLAERIVFINNKNYQFYPTVKTFERTQEKRKKNTLELNIPDSITSNLSVSITDAGLPTDSANNIVSQLLLCGDIKGYIHHPLYYFSAANADSIEHYTDLVMLTHGWRKYNWDNIRNAQIPYLPYGSDSTYISFQCKIFDGAINSAAKKPDVLLVYETKKGEKKSSIESFGSKDSFRMTRYSLYDSLKIYYKFVGTNPTDKSSELVFSNNLLSTYPTKYYGNNLNEFNSALTNNSRMKFINAELTKIKKEKNVQQLQEVIVRTNAKKSVDVLEDKYATGMFSGGDAYQFDMSKDLKAQSSTDVIEFLRGLIPGLQITDQEGETILKWRTHHTSLFIDEVSTDVETLKSISITDIAYVKVFRPPFFGSSGGGAGGAVGVYLKTGADIKSIPGKGLPFKWMEGYSAFKEFYQPNYNQDNATTIADLRTTLYWNPYIILDAHQKTAKIEFNNNDISTKLRIVVEGINADGKLARVEKIIE